MSVKSFADGKTFASHCYVHEDNATLDLLVQSLALRCILL